MNFHEKAKKIADSKKAFYGIDVAHEFIEKKDYKPLYDIFKRFDREAKKYRNSCYITFGGYDELLDEIHEIPEAREYIQGMVDRFPYLFYYLNFDFDNHAHILGSLGDVQSYFTGELKPITDYGLYEDLPTTQVHLTISNKLFKKITNSLHQFGKRVNDIQGANKMIKKLDDLYNIV
jgi:hypothetical protein